MFGAFFLISGNRGPAWPVRRYAITAEERMLELQQRKKALGAGIYEAGGNADAALDTTDRNRAPLRAVGVIYCPATANLPTLVTASIGRSGRIQ
jgi:hypothetical protein